MSGPVSLGQAIGLIGGIPILKNGGASTLAHLKIPKHLAINDVSGQIGKLLSSVLGGGTGALLQSPLGSVLTPLTSALTTAQSSVTTALGASGSFLTTALANLSTSTGNLSALSDNLVGLASNPSLPGQLDVIAHMGILASLGSGAPAALSMATVLAPVHSAALLTAATAAVPPIVAQVLSGSLGILDGANQVVQIQAGIDAVTNASTGALAASSSAALSLCAAQSTIALLVAGPPEVVAAVQAAIRPDMMATVQGIVDAHNATLAIAASSQAAASEADSTVASAVALAAAEAAEAASTP